MRTLMTGWWSPHTLYMSNSNQKWNNVQEDLRNGYLTDYWQGKTGTTIGHGTQL